MQDSIILPSPPRVIKESKNEAQIEISGLYPGYGVTIGNALRRVMLSSLSGAAVTRVKIEKAQHEFSTIPGILEDVLTILLNVKQLRFKMHTSEPRLLTISCKGECFATGADIKMPSDVEIVNPQQHIATLTDKSSSMSMELTVEVGVGYVPRESLRPEKVEIGTMVLDAVFTPVRKVSCEVENMRVGTATNYNRIRFTIQTDGSITPQEAFLRALAILQFQLKQLERLNEKETAGFEEKESFSSGSEDQGEPEAESEMDILKIKIDDLKLSSRTINALNKAGIKTVGGLMRKSTKSIHEMEGVGERASQEIHRALGNLGLTLPSE